MVTSKTYLFCAKGSNASKCNIPWRNYVNFLSKINIRKLQIHRYSVVKRNSPGNFSSYRTKWTSKKRNVKKTYPWLRGGKTNSFRIFFYFDIYEATIGGCKKYMHITYFKRCSKDITGKKRWRVYEKLERHNQLAEFDRWKYSAWVSSNCEE